MDALVRGFSVPFSERNQHDYVDLPFLSSKGDTNHGSPSSSGVSSDASEESEYSDATLRLINQMLMEEDDLEDKPCMFQQCLALQATEKSFYDELGKEYPPFSNQNPHTFNLDRSITSPDGDYSPNSSSESSNSFGSINNFVDPSHWVHEREKQERDLYSEYTFESILQSIIPSNGGSSNGSMNSHPSPFQIQDSFAQKSKRGNSPSGSKEKKTRNREDGDCADAGRSNKQLASSTQESDDQLEMYDEVLLCHRLNPHLHQDPSLCLEHDHDASADRKLQQNQNEPAKGSNGGGGRGRGKKNDNKKEVVDLRTLLSQCAQAVSSADIRSANELLYRIKQHSSPYGDGTERLAHYFANALEARLSGTGTASYAAFTTKRISTADILKAYQVYVKASPFNKMSNMYANRSIGTLAQSSQRLHIIDFGILYGFQWPCLIQHLSLRTGGPPMVRITGIDFPQPGFRPAERVEETGRRLRTYCKRFGVPFKFKAIAKKWDTIDLEDLEIESDEVLVVNCLHRLKNVPDETVVVSSPRDAVLNLVKRINPDVFIHGVVNGTYNAPFFLTRFREGIFYASAMFDMFDATVSREDEARRMYEKEVLGRDIMNVVACEGTQRVERPESYKQWQVRNTRAGFRQLPLNQEIMRDVRAKVKLNYNKDFVVDEDGKWMLQGWRGRIMYALSCWKPNKE